MPFRFLCHVEVMSTSPEGATYETDCRTVRQGPRVVWCLRQLGLRQMWEIAGPRSLDAERPA